MYKTLLLKFDDEAQAKSVLYDKIPEEKRIQIVEITPEVYDDQGTLIDSGSFEEREIVVRPEQYVPKYFNMVSIGIKSEPTGEVHMVTLAPGYEVEAPVFRDLPGWFVEIFLLANEKTDQLQEYIVKESGTNMIPGV